MTKTEIGYWVSTGILTAELIGGGALELARSNAIFNIMVTLAHLGYPSYVAIVFGTWKILGGIVLVLPRWPLLKEWVYAGVTSVMTGAIASHLFSGDGLKAILPPLMFLAFTAASWALRPEDRRVRVAPDAPRRGES